MYHYKAKVEKVVDDDNFDVVNDLGFNTTTNHRIRMDGINTLETYTVKKDSKCR